MLPPGEMPSRHIKKQLGERGEKQIRMIFLDQNIWKNIIRKKIVEGINGFKGYIPYPVLTKK